MKQTKSQAGRKAHTDVIAMKIVSYFPFGAFFFLVFFNRTARANLVAGPR